QGDDDHRNMRQQRKLQELGKVFAVERERAPIESAQAISVRSQSAGESHSSLRTCCRILLECRHNLARDALWQLAIVLAQRSWLIVGVRANYGTRVSFEWGRPGQHLIRDDA